jgi:hypothetical protein
MDYVFVPFMQLTADMGRKAEAVGGKIVIYRDHGQALQGFKSANDRLFVIGHCHAGSDKLSLTHTGSIQVSAAGVADRLIDAGLTMQQPAIKIILLACEAGRADALASFADHLTEEMTQKKNYLVAVKASSQPILVSPDLKGWSVERLGPNKRSGIREFTRPTGGSGKRPAR